MPTYVNTGDTIEGQAVDCNGRVFFNQGLKKHPLLQKTMNHYTTDRNSSAIVREAGVVPEVDDIRSATDYYHRNVGDRIECDAMSIYTEKRIRIEVLHGSESASSQHGIQYAGISKHTIASVKMPLPNLMKQLGYSNNSITDKNAAK